MDFTRAEIKVINTPNGYAVSIHSPLTGSKYEKDGLKTDKAIGNYIADMLSFDNYQLQQLYKITH